MFSPTVPIMPVRF